MLTCLNKIVNRIDSFQEDCATLIFGLKHLLGEDQIINESSFTFKKANNDVCVYRGMDLVLTENADGLFVEPEFVRNNKLIEESVRFLKRALKNEDSNSGPLGGTSARVDGQQLGGRSKEQLQKKEYEEDGGTSIADIATVPQVLGKKTKKKSLKEGLVAGATLPAQDAVATINGGKAKITKVVPSKANGLQKTLTVVDTGQ
jgi:hypothetical protein